jgi:hypothetical protein
MRRYLLNFAAADETAEASFFAYDDVAKLMVLKDCHLILNPLKLTSGLPQPLQSVISKKFTFSVNLTEDSFSFKSKRQYLVKHILDRSDRRHSALNLAESARITHPAPALPTTSAHPHASVQLLNAPPTEQQVLQIAQDNQSVCQIYISSPLLLIVSYITIDPTKLNFPYLFTDACSSC